MHHRGVTFLTIVLDGVGIGAQPDAGKYGDEDSRTLQHVCRAASPRLPNLQQLGLGNIAPLDGVPPAESPSAAYGRMQEVSAGKDSTTGHWELAGLRLERPFPTYADGFPRDLIERLISATDCGGVLGNKPSSGTAIIDELGAEHVRTGFPIVYTSADSVMQIAAHRDVFPVERLYRLCEMARKDACVGDHAVGRVIARPFVGSDGSYTRVSSERKDYALAPPVTTIQETLQAEGVRTVSIGKISDLFAGIGFHEAIKTSSNRDGLDEIERRLRLVKDEPTFMWANLIDFDQEYGHRNDPAGFARALEAFDAALPALTRALPAGALLVVTADHGNDPTTASTDHSREFVPLLVYGAGAGADTRANDVDVDAENENSAPARSKWTGAGRNLGTRRSFCDHAATAAAYFGARFDTDGQPFEVFS